MKPRNKTEVSLLKKSGRLPSLTGYQISEMKNKFAINIAKYKKTAKQYTCFMCGETWQGESADEVVCPHCGARLKVNNTKKQKFIEKYYFSVVTTCDEFQVIRMFYLTVTAKCGKAIDYFYAEVFQRWILPNGKYYIISRLTYSMSHCLDSWVFNSPLEIRRENYQHSVLSCGNVGKPKVLPIFKRNGFDGNFRDCDPYHLLMALLKYNIIETLWKTKHYDEVASLIYSHKVEYYQIPLKICIRHNYFIQDMSLWTDLLDALHMLGKDIRNPKFICPENLEAAHDYWVAEMRRDNERLERARIRARNNQLKEEYRKNADELENAYLKDKGAYLGICLKEGEITIAPLQNVGEFINEGEVMHHCVYALKYHQKKDALIFHALANNEILATIEFDLCNMKIIQCRGKYNSVPKQKEQIEKLITNNINQIIKCKQLAS